MPYHIIENPITEIHHYSASTKNVVVATNNPDCPGVFQHTTAFSKPSRRKIVIGLHIIKFVPLVINRINYGLVRPKKLVLELKVIGRISKNQVYGLIGQGFQYLNTITS